MSTIATLGILGVRSYSVEQQEVIHFKSPLTLILGNNGSGKTTIIESLRFATCGSLPPGTGNGKAFVLEPKLAGMAEVKSIVKLKFYAINKMPVLCVRKMSLRRKNNKLEFKKEEQTLKVKGEKGEDLTVAHNSQEIDRQVPELMGVSKAVLENVIFCHQEDSLWPFRDNIALKGIFDELFETTKFTKLYDTLTKLYREARKKLRDEKASLDLTKHQYETMVQDMRAFQGVIENIRKNLSQIRTETKLKDELQSSLKEGCYEEKVRILDKEKCLNEYRLEECTKARAAQLELIAERDHVIDSMLLSSKEEVQRNVQQKCDSLLATQQATKSKIDELEIEYKQLKEITVDFDVGEEKREIQRLSSELIELLHLEQKSHKLETKHLIDLAVKETNDRDLEVIGFEKSITDDRQNHLNNLVEIKTKIASLNAQLQRHESKLQDLTHPDRLNQIRKMEETRQKHVQTLEKLKQDYQVQRAARTDASAVIGNCISQIAAYADSSKIFEISTDYINYHNWTRELKTVEEQKAVIESKIRNRPNRSGLPHSQDSITFIGLEALLKDQNLLVTKAATDVKNAEKESIECAALLSCQDKLKADLEAENIALKDKLFVDLGGSYPSNIDIYQRYSEVKGWVRRLEEDLGKAQFGKTEFFFHLLEASKDTGKCSLCSEPFLEGKFAERMNWAKHHLCKETEEEKKAKKELDDFKKELEILRTHKPTIEKIKSNNDRINEAEKELERLYALTGKNQHRIQQALAHQKQIEAEMSDIKEMQILIYKTDDLTQKINGIDKRKFEGHDEETLYKTYQRGLPKPADLTALMSEKQKSLQVIDSNMLGLDQRILETDKLLTEANKLLSRVGEDTECDKLIQELEKSVLDVSSEIDELTDQMSKEEAKFADMIQAKENQLKVLKASLAKLNYLLPDLERRHENLSKLNTSNMDETTIASNYRKYKEVESQLETARAQYTNITSQLISATSELVLIQNKIQLYKTESQILALKTTVAEQTREIEELKEKVNEEKALTMRLNTVTANLSNLEGKDSSHKQTAQGYYDRIYHNRDKELLYFEKLTHFEYYRLLVEDLEVFVRSLESALVKYHRDKIEVINKNIAELWKLTYMHGDIKKIEIKADLVHLDSEDDGGPEGLKKCTFNYRVLFYNKE